MFESAGNLEVLGEESGEVAKPNDDEERLKLKEKLLELDDRLDAVHKANLEGVKNAELNNIIIESDKQRTEIEDLEKDLIQLEKEREKILHNKKFREEHFKWLSIVAGILQLRVEDLCIEDSSGKMHFSERTCAAIENSKELVSGKLPDVLREENLFMDNDFKNIIALKYTECNGYSRFERSIGNELEKHLFSFVKKRVSKDELARVLLGELGDCGGCLC